MIRAILVLVALAVAVVFPLGSNGTVTSIAVFALIYAIMATAWNILGGYTGYISLGHATFFGIGAYALVLISEHWKIPGGYEPFFLLPVVGLIAAAFAVPLGVITLRTRRHVFVVLTIAMLFIFQLLATNNIFGLTSGSVGLSMPIPTWSGSAYNIPFYYAALTFLVLAVATSWLVRHSKFGLGLLSIREDEDRAQGLGVPVGAYKLVAFVIPAFYIGIAGALYGYFQTFVYPSFVFNPLDDLAMALMTFFGGIGTLFGPVLGALVIESAQQYFAFTVGGGLYLVFYGALFLLVILLMPRGVVPALFGLYSKWIPRWRKPPSVSQTTHDELTVKRVGAKR